MTELWLLVIFCLPSSNFKDRRLLLQTIGIQMRQYNYVTSYLNNFKCDGQTEGRTEKDDANGKNLHYDIKGASNIMQTFFNFSNTIYRVWWVWLT